LSFIRACSILCTEVEVEVGTFPVLALCLLILKLLLVFFAPAVSLLPTIDPSGGVQPSIIELG